MLILKEYNDILNFFKNKSVNQTVGFVPTMGALHKGHLSLFERSVKENDITIGSIFVNPIQFNSAADLERYPRTLEQDLILLKSTECDALFLPSSDLMYPSSPIVTMKFGYMEDIMEGKFRPGHFNGVGIVVSKFFNLIKPDRAYFGQKDLQQFLIIQQMVKDLSFKIDLIACPIIREENGLAMSSRNERLSEDGRKLAGKIFESLSMAKNLLDNHSINFVKEKVIENIAQYPDFQLEYFEIVDFETLKDVKNVKEHTQIALCTALHLEGVRLIDNVLLFS